MTINELRTLYREHELVEAIIEPSSHDDAYIVEFRHVRGGFVILTDSSGEECHYANLDTASRSAMAVGFNQVRIES